MNPTRSVIFTADDFGAVDAVNLGIIKGVETGLIQTVSTLVTFPESLRQISELHRQFPKLCIGLHFSLSAGTPMLKNLVPSLIDKNGNFPDIRQLMGRLDSLVVEELRSEMDTQLKALQSVLGPRVPIDHISSHHNIAGFYTPIFQVMLYIAKEYELPVRSPMTASVTLKAYKDAPCRRQGTDTGKKFLLKHPLEAVKVSHYASSTLMLHHQTILNELGIKHPEYLVDSFWGSPTPANLFMLLKNLPEGVSEVVFHLGLNERETISTHGISQDYLFMRELELFCLNPTALRRWLELLNIQMTSYAEIILGRP